jgi:hypothetical protein
MQRQPRSITIPSEELAPPKGDWSYENITPHCAEQRWRVGDRLFVKCQSVLRQHGSEQDAYFEHTRQTSEYYEMSAIVPYAALAARGHVEEDDYYTSPPWEECEGWEHTLQSCENFQRHLDDTSHCYVIPAQATDHFKASNATYYDTNACEFFRIVLDDAAQRGLLQYYRARGASRQVAAELCAVNKRQTISQLRDWRKDGWHWYSAVAKWTAADGKCYEDSLGGFNNEDDAEAVLLEDVIPQVIHELELDGFIVQGQPPSLRRYGGCTSKEKYRERLQKNLHGQDWPYLGLSAYERRYKIPRRKSVALWRGKTYYHGLDKAKAE